MIKRQTNWLYLVCEGLCVMMSIGFVLMCGYSNSPLFLDYGTDGPIFLTVGKGITMGMVPYVDIVENKGPLLFLLNGLPQYFVPGTTGAFILELLMSIGACLLILRTARYVQGEDRNAACVVLPVALYYIVACRHMNGGNFGEEYNLFLIVAAMALLVRTLYAGERDTRRNAFGLGAAAMAVALIKISDIFAMAVTVLFYIAWTLRRKKPFWKEAGAFVAGLAVVAAPVFGYLIATGSVGAMFQEYILSNFSHVSTGEDVGFLASRAAMLLSGSEYAQASLLPLWAALIAAAVGGLLFWLGRKQHDHAEADGWLLAFGVAIAAAATVSAYVSITGYGQHLIPTAAPLMLSCLIVTAAIARLLRGRLLNVLTGLAALTLAVVMVGDSGIYIPQRPFVTSEAYQEDVSYQTEFLDRIEDEKDSVFCINVAREWYCFNDVMPAYKYINLINYINNGVGEGVDKDFEAYITQGEIKWLVVQWDIEDYRGILTDDTIDYINENYVLDQMDSRELRSLYELI